MPNKEYNREYAAKKRAERKAANLCPDCGQPKDKDGYRCSKCTDRNNKCSREADKEFINSKQKARRADHVSKGLCSHCNNVAAEGYRKCLSCIETVEKLALLGNKLK